VATLPNLIIIGSQKCGTTSLHNYLSFHPDVFMSRTKELNFFAEQGNWHKGLDWYRSNFEGPACVYGESSPNYTNWPFWTGVPERMYSIIPEAKLIFLVRDPIERLLAHYVHRFAVGLENRPLSEALAVFDANPYICRSQYYLQLSQFLKFYPLSKVLILQQVDLKRARTQTMRQVFQFLEVDPEFSSPLLQLEAHRTRDKRRLSPWGRRIANWAVFKATSQVPIIGWRLRQTLLRPFSEAIERPVPDDSLRARLVEFIKPDLDRFYDLTGQTFPGWNN
jgi:hypothetical protein